MQISFWNIPKNVQIKFWIVKDIILLLYSYNTKSCETGTVCVFRGGYLESAADFPCLFHFSRNWESACCEVNTGFPSTCLPTVRTCSRSSSSWTPPKEAASRYTHALTHIHREKRYLKGSKIYHISDWLHTKHWSMLNIV